MRATPHRVRRRDGADVSQGRLSMPFFFDPNFDSLMTSVYDQLSDDLKAVAESNRRDSFKNKNKRWDNINLKEYEGTTYGDYLLMKVRKVFPALADDFL